MAAERDLAEGQHAADGGQHHAEHGCPLRELVAEPAAEQAADGRPQQGEEDGADEHGPQPFRVEIPSTSMLPRLRK